MGLAKTEIRIAVFREQPEMLPAAYQKVQAEGKLRFRVGLGWVGFGQGVHTYINPFRFAMEGESSK